MEPSAFTQLHNDKDQRVIVQKGDERVVLEGRVHIFEDDDGEERAEITLSRDATTVGYDSDDARPRNGATVGIAAEHIVEVTAL